MSDPGPLRAASTLLLASSSPQRRALLTQVGIPFIACDVDVEELTDGEPGAVALENARRKASAGAVGAAPGQLVVGVDTVVALDGRIYGKPPDQAAARRTLRALGGRRHEVLSGLATLRDGELRSAVAMTRVSFRALKQETLESYVATREWRGRAGGYAIQGQGAALVSGIEGDYANVVGLPLACLLDLHPELAALAAPSDPQQGSANFVAGGGAP